VFDASNIEVYFRRKRLNEWKNKYHARICGIVCLVPKHEVLKRNRERLDTVPEVIVEKIWDEFVRDPIDTSKDLFDELSVVDEFGFVRSVYRRSCEYDLHNKTPDIILSPVEFRQK
jgi:tRNA uridine 5-carbamoylmethylation protein Kti12